MNINFTELKKRLKKRELEVLTDEDREKVDVIKKLFLNSNCFFEIDMNVAINILSFLGINDDDLLDTYYDLINPKNYQKLSDIPMPLVKDH